jgi:hypothetical protein
MKAFAGTFGSPAIMPMELLTRGFASLPFDSFALSVIKLLNNIIEHFEDEVNYYSDWFACNLLLEKKAGIYVFIPGF